MHLSGETLSLHYRRRQTEGKYQLHRVILKVEQLEERLVLSADSLEPHLLFAPDTPQAYMEQFDHDHDHQGCGCSCPSCMSALGVEETGIAAFQLSNRFSGTAGSGGGLGQGDDTIITWSIVPDNTSIQGFAGEPTSGSNLVSYLAGIYGANSPGDGDYTNEPWFSVVSSTFDRWSELSGITYVYEPNDDGASFAFADGVAGVRGDVRLSGHTIDGPSGILAYNFFPQIGDMVIDTGDNFYLNTGSNSLRLRNVLTHEQGHGFGLQHVESNNANFLMEPFINLGFDGPQLDDILGAHRHYGDANESLGGNDSVTSASPLGALNAGSSLTVGADGQRTLATAEIFPGQADFVSIDDNSDVDIYRFTVGANTSLDVLLTPVGFTYNQGSQGGSQSPFNPAAQSDLTLQLLNGSGTVLATSNGSGLGGSESLSDFLITSAGTYHVRVSGANNAVQLYQLDLSADAVAAPPAGVTVTESNGSTEVSEDGAVDSYTIALDTVPTGTVTIQITSGSQLLISADGSNYDNVLFLDFNNQSSRTIFVTAVDDGNVEGVHTGTITHTVTASLDPGYAGLPIDDVSVSITDNDVPPPPENEQLYFSVAGTTTLQGASGSLTVRNEDIVAFDGNDYSILFDGSDVGLGGLAIDAFDVLSPTEILISFSAPSGNVDDSDVLLFVANSLGENTSGSFFWFLDGSDVGLTTNGEDIDAITALDDGSLLISTTGSARVVGGAETFRDEDVIRFVPTSLGSATSGSFSMFFDGSTLGLGGNGAEDIDSVAVQNGTLYFTTVGNFSFQGLTGDDDDITLYRLSDGSFTPGLGNLTTNDIKGLDFAGVAGSTGLGLFGALRTESLFVGTETVDLGISSTITGAPEEGTRSVIVNTPSPRTRIPRPSGNRTVADLRQADGLFRSFFGLTANADPLGSAANLDSTLSLSFLEDEPGLLFAPQRDVGDALLAIRLGVDFGDSNLSEERDSGLTIESEGTLASAETEPRTSDSLEIDLGEWFTEMGV